MKISLNGIRRLLTFRVVTEFFGASDKPAARFDTWTGPRKQEENDPPEVSDPPKRNHRLVRLLVHAFVVGWISVYALLLLVGLEPEAAFNVAVIGCAVVITVVAFTFLIIWL